MHYFVRVIGEQRLSKSSLGILCPPTVNAHCKHEAQKVGMSTAIEPQNENSRIFE